MENIAIQSSPWSPSHRATCHTQRVAADVGLKGRCTMRDQFVSLDGAGSQQAVHPESSGERSRRVESSRVESKQTGCYVSSNLRTRANARAVLSSREPAARRAVSSLLVVVARRTTISDSLE
jgi:hypothetical protein